MKIMNLAVFLVILFFTSTFSQPLLPRERSEEALQDELNLSNSQKEKIEKILADKRESLDKIRNKMMAVMDRLRDSTGIVSSQADKEIMNILDNEQAEKFKSSRDMQTQYAMIPPAMGMGNDYYLHSMPSPNRIMNDSGQFRMSQGPVFLEHDQNQPCCKEVCVDDSETDFPGPDSLDSDDIDFLLYLDSFDILNILY
jgi:uncharacterized coiled-coil protein SlyX